MELSRQHYRDVFGWDAAGVATAPGYSVFQQHDEAVVGLRHTPGLHRWVPYISVESVDRMAARVQAAGGIIDTAPFDTPGVARTCVIRDPDGGVFGLWEGRGRGEMVFWRDVPHAGRFGIVHDAGDAEFCVMRPLARS